jgi:hypothetical protein
MKIGILDNMFASLQGQLAAEGHTIKVFVNGLPKLPKKSLPATHQGGTYEQAMSLAEFADCDMIIAGDADRPGMSAYCKMMFPDKPVMYYSADMLMLEDDRILAHHMIERCIKESGVEDMGIPSTLRLPRIKEFTTRKAAQTYLASLNMGVVIKKNLYSHEEAESMRTLIVKDPANFEIPDRNNWFDEKGNGGCTIEQYIDGPEICFGMWFNGEKFVGQPYICMEHKGAWAGDMGGVLTGEVGTSLMMFEPSLDSKVMEMFEMIAPMFKGKVNGMIDFNTKMTAFGGLVNFYFMEFTVRFGRPTLECQIAAMSANHVQTGDWLFKSLTGEYPKLDAVTMVTGVIGFTYGLPIVTNIIEGLNRSDIDLTSYIPSFGTRWQANDFLQNPVKLDPGTSRWWLPLITMYDNDVGAYVATREDRHFIALGALTIDESVLADPNDATPFYERTIDAAYSMLDGVQLKGIVWRHDIGRTFMGAISKLGGML